MTTFLLVRHGYTEWIEKEILHGISDLPLQSQQILSLNEHDHLPEESTS